MKPQIENTIPDNIEIELRDREIIHVETGSHTILPSDTIRRAERTLQKIGVIAVEQIDRRFTDGIPIFRLNKARVKAKCHRRACRWSPPPTPLNNPPKEIFGKGMTEEQSKASAMMEAIERYCGQKFLHSQTIDASHEEVRGYGVQPSEFNFPKVPPKCENCGDRERGCFQDLQEVCQEWTWGYSLINKSPVLVPSALVYYPYISKKEISFIFNDTGGLAAGNTIEEAILQGIAEIIERDALYYALNLGNMRHMSMISFASSENVHIQKFIGQILPPEKVFAFHIWNKDMDLSIPTFAAFVCYQIRNKRLYFGGSGTSLDHEVGLLRALTEVEQQKVRQKILFEFDPNDLVSHNSIKREDVFDIKDIRNQSTGNIGKDIDLYLDRLSRINTDVIVVDLTHPEIDIPVVRAIIPKLISYSGSPVKESVMLDTMKAFGGKVDL